MDSFSFPRCPRGPVDVILDTDAFNEIDDQFAIAYLLHAGEKLRIRALCAAPFFNDKSTGPQDGMEKSYQEILHILQLAGRNDLASLVYRGSTCYLPDERTPVQSEAAEKIIEIAREYSPQQPLYIVAIGAITNVASALLTAPDIAEKIVIIWLGGHALHWPDNHEFNLSQDVAAARVIFGSAASLVQLPCMGVVSSLTTTGPELIHWLRGKNALCDYLCDHTIAEAESYAAGKPWSRVIWDISAIAWLLNEDQGLMRDRPEHRPMPLPDGHYELNDATPYYSYIWHVNRDAIFQDVFSRLTK